MKKILLISVLVATSLSVRAQALHIFHDGKAIPDVIANGGVDSIYFTPKFLGSSKYQWVFETQDGEKRYDIVDSVKFNQPHLVALRHNYYVPVDYVNYFGAINIIASCSGNFGNLTISEKEGKRFDVWNGWGSSTHLGTIENVPCYPLDRESEEIVNSSETWYLFADGLVDSITVNYTDKPFFNSPFIRMRVSADEKEYVIDTNFPDPEILLFEEDGYGYINKSGKPVMHIYYNDSGENKIIVPYLSASGFVLIEPWISQMNKTFKHTPEEHMAALREFCDATDFPNWKHKDNWWSKEPLWEWEGINKVTLYDETFWNTDGEIAYMNLDLNGSQYNGIHGTIPASFEVFLDDADDSYPGWGYPGFPLNLENCALYGKVPYNLRHHEKWSKYGWNFLLQNPWYGGGLDLEEDSNLRMKDEEVMFADETKSTAYEELAKHRLTLVAVGGPSEAMCNLCLAYANKGFHYIYAAQDWLGGTQEEAQRSAYLYKNVPNVSVYYRSWANGNLSDGLRALGSTFLLDSEGNVIDYAPMDWGLGEELYTNRLGKHLLNILGEPEEHEPYVPYEKEYYTSSDYSHDGEVVTLQKATAGRGIDLVFMGDQYVDSLLVGGGKYEEDMRIGMEYFFGVEPYKSLRERFNVYAVKAVSPNGNDGPVHKFNMQNDKVFEYTRKIPDVDMNNVAITVIHNAPNGFFVSGETGMWESGASIAWIEQGGPSSIICHETGGHGFAKLLDEYVYSGYESNHTQEGYNEEFREWIKTAYHDKGWGMNVSATDNPDEVPWSRFLKDERYKDEIGIYKGAWFWPEELWRSSENSVMNNDYSWFNAPSREAIYKRVMQLSEGEDWTYDYETFVAFDAPVREAYKKARAESRLDGSNGQNVQQRRVELRPPTIHKGSWHDADKQENVDDGIDKFVKATNIVRMASKSNEENVNGEPKHYVMYKGERIDAEDFYRNRNKYK